MIKQILLVFSVAFYPLVSHAGAGFQFRITNNMFPSLSDANYPQFTVHISGGSDCWYDNGLADWNQFAKPGGGKVTIYTERKNSGFCPDVVQALAVRGIAYFVKRSKNSPWEQVGNQFVLYNNYNNLGEFYTKGKEPKTVCYPPYYTTCQSVNGFFIDSDYNYTKGGDGEKFKDANVAWVNIDVIDWDSLMSEKGSAVGEHEYEPELISSISASEREEFNAKTYTVKVNDRKRIVLGGLDAESEWELDQCVGESVVSSDVLAIHTPKKDLPDIMEIKALKPGQAVCEITAWHYPERSKVTSRRYTFIIQ